MSSFQIVLFDDPLADQLLPLTYTRAVCELRVGILKIKEKWEIELESMASILTRSYLAPLYSSSSNTGEHLYINGSLLPTALLLKEMKFLDTDCVYCAGDVPLFIKTNEQFISREELFEAMQSANKKNIDIDVKLVQFPWHIFSYNGEQIVADIERLQLHPNAAAISDNHNIIIGEDKIYIEDGAKVQGAILNASNGPIYFGTDSEVMEGSTIRGPFALCAHSTVKMSAKIYGDTTVGPHSKVGGEITNSVILGYSNKGHDGFLGNSVLGEWCNLGADTNNSNLKNNYGEVSAWNYAADKFVNTGLQFCGLIMGDHSKSGINTMFNTGTVVGVSCNIFGGGFPRKFIPSFSWGGYAKLRTFQLDKAYEVAERMMARRSKNLTQEEKQVLKHIFELDGKHRKD